jgi:predicted DNA-binding transcriptional regulator YafY
MGTSKGKEPVDGRAGNILSGLSRRRRLSQEQKDHDRISRIILVSTKLIAASYRSPRGISVKEMQGLCSVSPKSIYRDIIAITRTGAEVDNDGKGMWWIKPGDFIPPMQFTDSEAVMLFLASRLLAQNSNAYNPVIISAFEKLNAAFRNPVSLQIAKSQEWLSKQPQAAGQVNIMNELATAWIKGHRIKMRYQKLGNKTGEEREVDIYFIQPALLEHANYLIGYCHKMKRISVFKIDRIKSVAQIYGQDYAIPGDFNINQFLGYAWGISAYGELQYVAIKFKGELATVAAETRWHPSQVNEPQKDGSVIVRFKLQVSRPFIGFIMSWGPWVEAISPKSLRNEVAEEARAVCKVYG